MRLLLAEDEKALSKVLVTILERNNYSVDPVYDGQSALEFIETGNYDGAILDIMMPVLDGIEVLKKNTKPRQSYTGAFAYGQIRDRRQGSWS